MTYRAKTVLEQKEYNFTLHQGGLGDLIAQLPAIKYTLDTHPQLLVNLWLHDYAKPLCEKLFSHYGNVTVTGLSEQKEKYQNDLPARSPYVHRITNLSSHLTDQAFLTIAGKSVEDKYKNYIQLDPIDVSEFNLPEKYVVVTTGYTSDTRIWKAESVNETCDYIISKGYTPVFLGKTYTKSYFDTGIVGKFEADYTKGINLIDKTDLFQAHAIMANSTCTIGLDNGLLHLACMSDVPVVYGFTTVNPEHRLPYRNDKIGHNCFVVMPTKEELKCIGCQSNMTFVDSSHDFRRCFYSDYLCLDLMSSNKFFKYLST